MGRLHSNLQKLEDLRPALSYKGWEVDFRDAEDAHSQSHYATDFPKTLRKMKVRQKLHDGDRSHPRLVKLDAIIENGLNYPGWEVDVKQVENMHAEVPYLPRSDVGFNSKLRRLEYSQQMHHSHCKDVESSWDDHAADNIRYPPVLSRKQHNQSTTKSATTSAATVPHLEESTSDCSSSCSYPSAMGDCIICGCEARSHAFLPCGHLSVCGECSSKVMRRTSKCPVCQGSATSTVQIFLP